MRKLLEMAVRLSADEPSFAEGAFHPGSLKLRFEVLYLSGDAEDVFVE
jgi:hypothetical protein